MHIPTCAVLLEVGRWVAKPGGHCVEKIAQGAYICCLHFILAFKASEGIFRAFLDSANGFADAVMYSSTVEYVYKYFGT